MCCQCKNRRNRCNNSNNRNQLASTCAVDTTIQGGTFYSSPISMSVEGVTQTRYVTEVIPVIFQQVVTQDTIVNQVHEVQGVQVSYQAGSTHTIAPTSAPTCNDLQSASAADSNFGCGCGCR